MTRQPTKQEIINLIVAVSGAFELPSHLIVRQCEAESSFQPNARSSCDAYGLFQLMASTAKELGVNRYHWVENVLGGIMYMSRLSTYYKGNLAKAFAAYNWGMGNINRVSKEHGENWYKYLPQETATYLVRIGVTLV